MRIAICDDDLDFVNELEQYVYKISEANNCSCDIAKLYNEIKWLSIDSEYRCGEGRNSLLHRKVTAGL